MTAQVENASEATQPDAKHSHGSPTFAQNWTADDEDEIRRPEPIAIIGMGCRLPGHANSVSNLWDLLINARSGHGVIPSTRFNAAGFYHPDAQKPGGINSEYGYFIREDIHGFENGFFGINNLEAAWIDPQQRKLMEVVYECIENAGVPLEHFTGTNTGCFVGNYTFDFAIMQYKDPENFSRYAATGAGPTILANRINYVFDLRGPSVVFDTACSSSLYALHFACKALQNGDCSAAICAGANLIQTPEQQMIAVKGGILSADSICHTFDASASGYGRAEGVGALYLKPLSAAIRDGNCVRAVIRGTAVNSDGKTSGITLPSVFGQEAVIRKAYAMAGLPTNATDYIEAHGTGTNVGDPIEVEALSRAFYHKTGRPTLIGSVKTNIGHSEGASGISSIIKVVLALEKKLIPPTIGLRNINPKIETENWNVRIVTKPTAWPATEMPRASVNSFGFGGSNAHAILEAADIRGEICHNQLTNGMSHSRAECAAPITLLLPFSAHTKWSLEQMVGQFAQLQYGRPNGIDARDLAHHLATRRSDFATKGFIICDHASIQSSLQSRHLKMLDSGLKEPYPIGFVFTGQGAQSPQMAFELLKKSSTFRRSIESMDSFLSELPKYAPLWTLGQAILEPVKSSKMNTALYSQSACIALQIALTDVLGEWDIQPTIVLGHSSGEIAAAYSAGILSKRQAISAAYYRGLVLSECKTSGAMMAVGLDKRRAQDTISEFGLDALVVVACFNSMESVTLSGNAAAVDTLFECFLDRKIFARKLRTDDKAYHSPHMWPIGEEYEGLLTKAWSEMDVAERRSDRGTRMISSVTGKQVNAEQVATPAYWRRNLESPVLFEDALRTCLETTEKLQLIEVGPHPALQLPVEAICKAMREDFDAHIRYHPTLQRDRDSLNCMFELVGSLYLHGHTVPFGKVNGLQPMELDGSHKPKRGFLKDLPPYPWNYEFTKWHEPRVSREFRNRCYPRHELLGSMIPGQDGIGASWRNVLDLAEVSWLKDHCLGPVPVFPAAGYLSIAVEAMSQVLRTDAAHCPALELRDFHLKALTLPEEKSRVELFTTLKPVELTNSNLSTQWWAVTISSFAEGESTVHAKGILGVNKDSKIWGRRFVYEREHRLEQQAPRVWYNKFKEEGLVLGPAFTPMEEIFVDRARQQRVAFAKANFSRDKPGMNAEKQQFVMHPIFIELALQTGLVSTTAGVVRDIKAKVPVSIRRGFVRPSQTTEVGLSKPLYAYSSSEIIGFGTAKADAELYNENNEVLMRLEDVRSSHFGGKRQDTRSDDRSPLVRVQWKPDLSLLSPEGVPSLARYLDYIATSQGKKFPTLQAARVAGLLGLLVHKNPCLRILELGTGDLETTKAIMISLRAGSLMRRFTTYAHGVITCDGDIVVRSLNTQYCNPVFEEDAQLDPNVVFDVIVLPDSTTSTQNIDEHLSRILSHAALGAYVICSARNTIDASQIPANVSYTIFPVDSGLPTMLFHIPLQLKIQDQLLPECIFLVGRDYDDPLSKRLEAIFSEGHGRKTVRTPLSGLKKDSIPSGSTVISTIELNEPFLVELQAAENDQIKALTDRASRLLWITGGALLKGRKPEFSAMLGLARVIVLEQPSLRFCFFDTDDPVQNVDLTASNICMVLKQLHNNQYPDTEFLQDQGVVHVSRWYAEERLNGEFLKRVNEETEQVPLGKASCSRLSIDNPGQFDSVCFVRPHGRDKGIKDDFVEIEVKSVGMNAKDIYALSGKIDTQHSSCSCEFAGIVTRAGSKVSRFKPGDRVVAWGPGFYSPHEQVPQWSCAHLLDNEDFKVMSTVPVAFSTALYALKHRADLQPGESVLIHSATGGVGVAAIQLARWIGAEIFATVSTDQKKQYLIDEFGIRPDQIFNSRDSSFLTCIMTATAGHGVDVVLNSLTGELLHDSWHACAEFGRFIEIGKRDILDKGKLEMDVFERNVAFIAFDLMNLFYSTKLTHHEILRRLLNESLSAMREGHMKPVKPLQVFDVSEITQAFRQFSLGSRMGKIAVSFEDRNSLVKVRPNKYNATFSDKKSYLMIGGLGGLGRSITKYMVSKGARDFVFLQRTGTDKTPARLLVEDLTNAGVSAKVLKGDVCKLNDVEEAIAQANFPIGGVVQAAMGHDELLWTSMSSESWHIGIDPKVRGTWNLHNSLRRGGRDNLLDFFLLTSSSAGTVATAKMGSYSAGNTFLDFFARYRQSLGLPVISVGLGNISEVGYLHEHPEIEALMARRAVRTINEDEMLQILDIALTESSKNSPASNMQETYDWGSMSHILAGVEFIDLARQRSQGFEANSHVLDDPRASHFTAAFARLVQNQDINGSSHQTGNLPKELASALKGGKPASILEAVQEIVASKIANLILLPREQLDAETHFSKFGLDSMIAAEFRGYVFRMLDVDVPFMMLLEKDTNVKVLAQLIAKELEQKNKPEGKAD